MTKQQNISRLTCITWDAAPRMELEPGMELGPARKGALEHSTAEPRIHLPSLLLLLLCCSVALLLYCRYALLLLLTAGSVLLTAGSAAAVWLRMTAILRKMTAIFQR